MGEDTALSVKCLPCGVRIEVSRRPNAFVVLILYGIVALWSPLRNAAAQEHEKSIVNPNDAGNPVAAAGNALFERNCAVCHGIGGTGGRGPSLNRARLSRA